MGLFLKTRSALARSSAELSAVISVRFAGKPTSARPSAGVGDRHFAVLRSWPPTSQTLAVVAGRERRPAAPQGSGVCLAWSPGSWAPTPPVVGVVAIVSSAVRHAAHRLQDKYPQGCSSRPFCATAPAFPASAVSCACGVTPFGLPPVASGRAGGQQAPELLSRRRFERRSRRNVPIGTSDSYSRFG